MRSLSYDAYFSFLIFWATFGGKMGVATTRTPNGPWPPCPTKKLAHWVDFWANHYLEIIFSKFPGVNPPPPIRYSEINCNRELSIVYIALSLIRIKSWITESKILAKSFYNIWSYVYYYFKIKPNYQKSN